MKTLVINLERETARLAHMRKVFGEQGLDFTVVKAHPPAVVFHRESEIAPDGAVAAENKAPCQQTTDCTVSHPPIAAGPQY